MLYMKQLFLAAIVLVSGLTACGSGNGQDKNDRSTAAITGKVNFPQSSGIITLEEVGDNKPVVIDTVYLEGDSTYSLEVNNEEPGFYRVNFYNKQFVNLILSDEAIVVNADGNSQSGKSEVQGSTDTDYLKDINMIVQEFQNDMTSLNNRYVTAKNSGDEAKTEKVMEEAMEAQKEINGKIKNKIDKMDNSLAILYAINYLNPDDEYEFLSELAERLEKEMPHSKHAQQFVAQVKSMGNLSIGQAAPEIELPNPDGDMVKLSSLKGNYVLIDFWAAWCRPCRVENPNVVKLYNKYKDDGFEIFGVSLDRKKEDWLQAIEKDGLEWTQVSDLSYFESEAAREYNITAIPATYLLDKDGKIMAKNLRGKALEDKLAELF